ncbi:basic proline-rich protein-like [Gopherus evgoodei]|uniref:basic proline-rich protein-like n=1 Tax=Gopherus evgoodei TaxID=1825980 RepID=UPI0011CFFF3F|nr:basic proline-rich protein-like [Gopherus evgoodei]
MGAPPRPAGPPPAFPPGRGRSGARYAATVRVEGGKGTRPRQSAPGAAEEGRRKRRGEPPKRAPHPPAFHGGPGDTEQERAPPRRTDGLPAPAASGVLREPPRKDGGRDGVSLRREPPIPPLSPAARVTRRSGRAQTPSAARRALRHRQSAPGAAEEGRRKRRGEPPKRASRPPAFPGGPGDTEQGETAPPPGGLPVAAAGAALREPPRKDGGRDGVSLRREPPIPPLSPAARVTRRSGGAECPPPRRAGFRPPAECSGSRRGRTAEETG